jgi:hypothetical protein
LLEQPTQVCVPTLQTGVVPLQSAFAVQRTHVPFAVLQTGVAPPQAAEFPAEHWPHEPPGWQAGVAPPHSPSPPHARQVWNAGSQTGALPAQLLLARQPTHVFDVVLQ